MNAITDEAGKDRYGIPLLGYICFLALYYIPMGLQDSGFDLDIRAIRLLEKALSINSILIDLAWNIAGHLLLTGLFYLLVNFLTRKLGNVLRINKILLTLISVVWSWLLLCCINAQLFPKSLYVPPLPAIPSYLIISLSATALLVFIIQLLRSGKHKMLTLSILTVGTASLLLANRFPDLAKEQHQPRNVILIGIDSLSPNMLELSKNLLPNLTSIAKSSVQFSQAYTPIGRTFPSWTSILSGRPPAEHGAYFNLRDTTMIDRSDLLTRDLQAKGYRTVFAIDERRFCNIDESFGFDRVIGPKAGVLDFLLQRYNDSPLTNLALQSKVFSPFFAYSYMNTASFSNYDPEAILDEIGQELETKRPFFLAVHFESAHYPFKTSHTYTPLKHNNQFISMQSAALQSVDYQVGEMLHQLHSSGILNNALVILLSDHGEGLGENETIQTKNANIVFHDYGHGSNIVSDWQGRAILDITEFENGKIKFTPSVIAKKISLLNIRKIINDYVADGGIHFSSMEECFPVETGLRFFEAIDYKTIDQKKLAAEGLMYYTVNKDGRMVLRENTLQSKIETKDIGAWCGNTLTLLDRKENRIYSLRKDGNYFTEIETDPKGLHYLKNYINKYDAITTALHRKYSKN